LYKTNQKSHNFSRKIDKKVVVMANAELIIRQFFIFFLTKSINGDKKIKNNHTNDLKNRELC